MIIILDKRIYNLFIADYTHARAGLFEILAPFQHIQWLLLVSLLCSEIHWESAYSQLCDTIYTGALDLALSLAKHQFVVKQLGTVVDAACCR